MIKTVFLTKMVEEDLGLERVNCRAKGASSGFKVAILGAAGGIGQPLAMLMKMNPLVSLLHLYDVVNAPGVTADLSHMDTSAVVITSFFFSFLFFFYFYFCGSIFFS
jgi:malate dehydrogenase